MDSGKEKGIKQEQNASEGVWAFPRNVNNAHALGALTLAPGVEADYRYVERRLQVGAPFEYVDQIAILRFIYD